MKVDVWLVFTSENRTRETTVMPPWGQRAIRNCPEDTWYNAQFWQEHNNTHISCKARNSFCNCSDICFAVLSSLPHSPRTTEKQGEISGMEIRTWPLATRLLLRPKSVKNSLWEDSGLKNSVYIRKKKKNYPHWEKLILHACKVRKLAKLSRLRDNQCY